MTPRVGVVLPPGWRRINLAAANDDVIRQLAIGVDAAGQSRLIPEMRSTIVALRDSNTIFAAVMELTVEPVSLAASLLISEMPDQPQSLAAIELELRVEGDGRSFRPISLRVGPALEVTEVSNVEIGATGELIPGFSCQIFVPGPVRGGLALSFATPHLTLSDRFLTVFRSIAETLTVH